jgi:hypothetical protein
MNISNTKKALIGVTIIATAIPIVPGKYVEAPTVVKVKKINVTHTQIKVL